MKSNINSYDYYASYAEQHKDSDIAVWLKNVNKMDYLDFLLIPISEKVEIYNNYWQEVH